MKAWPNVKGVDDLVDWSKQITKIRNFEDVPQDEQLSSSYIAGRKVIRLPSSSGDVIAGQDRLGDIAFNTVSGVNYMYVLLSVSGSLSWQRVALGSF